MNDLKRITVVKNEVNLFFGTNIDDTTRQKEIREPRQIAMKICYDKNFGSNGFIGYNIAKKDHATVISARKKINGYIKFEHGFKAMYDEVLKKCDDALKMVNGNGYHQQKVILRMKLNRAKKGIIKIN